MKQWTWMVKHRDSDRHPWSLIMSGTAESSWQLPTPAELYLTSRERPGEYVMLAYDADRQLALSTVAKNNQVTR